MPAREEQSLLYYYYVLSYGVNVTGAPRGPLYGINYACLRDSVGVPRTQTKLPLRRDVNIKICPVYYCSKTIYIDTVLLAFRLLGRPVADSTGIEKR